MKLVLLPAMFALLVSACDAPSEPASDEVPVTANEDADFGRMATAGKMLSDLQTYFASGDRAPRTFTFDRLKFDSGSSVIRPVDQPTVHTLAITLRNNPDVRVQILGFGDGDRSGTDSNSLALRRAAAVATALRNAGVKQSRLEIAAGREANRQRDTQLVVLNK